MITATAARNPDFLAKVRRAMRLAGIRAIARGVKFAAAEVHNRKGQPVAVVVLHLAPVVGGPKFEVFDNSDRDITNSLRQAFALAAA